MADPTLVSRRNQRWFLAISIALGAAGPAAFGLDRLAHHVQERAATRALLRSLSPDSDTIRLGEHHYWVPGSCCCYLVTRVIFETDRSLEELRPLSRSGDFTIAWLDGDRLAGWDYETFFSEDCSHVGMHVPSGHDVCERLRKFQPQSRMAVALHVVEVKKNVHTLAHGCD